MNECNFLIQTVFKPNKYYYSFIYLFKKNFVKLSDLKKNHIFENWKYDVYFR